MIMYCSIGFVPGIGFFHLNTNEVFDNSLCSFCGGDNTNYLENLEK